MVDEFMAEMKRLNGGEMSRRYFYTCLTDLQNASIVKKLHNCTYFINPYVFWRDDKGKRVEYIKTYAGIGQTFAFNPLQLLLDAPDAEYNLETLDPGLNEYDQESIESQIKN